MRLRKVIWILTILWMTAIFLLSARPGDLSRQDSAWLLERANLITQEEAMDIENHEAMSLQMWIRKMAHVIIFGGLCMLFYASFYGYVGKAIKTGIWSWSATVLYGITDEIHQLFVPGRGAQIQDVFRDGKGALIGCLIMMAVFLLIERVPSINKIVDKIYNLNIEINKQYDVG
ncbi:MAG: VanZ family protein [Epulopiscium sp.]|nr:VanZ family protein [Candidatus Epulonipiscium sp.]